MEWGEIRATKEVRAMPIDPVCGMKVDEKKSAATYEYQGKTYYFCAVGCRDRFSQSPEKFLKDPNK
jgi:Cu+-exporting ATPase